MAISVTATGQVVVLDETDGLQNATATPSPANDANDNDTGTSLPTALSGRLTFYGLTADEAALSGYTGAGGNTGANIITVSGATATTDFALTGSGGAAFPDYESGATSSFDSGLSVVDDDGNVTEVFLFTDPTNNNIVYGVAGDSGDDPVAFVIYLDEQKTSGITTGAKMWTVLVDGYTLAHDTDGETVADHDDVVDLTDKLFVAAVAEASFTFAGAPAGNNLFMRFGTSDLSIVVTGKAPADQSDGANISSGSTVNTSGQTATSLGTDGQQVKAGKGMYFTYVTGTGTTPAPTDNYIVPNLDQNEADVEANIEFTDVVDARGGEFSISQVNPGSASTSVKIKITAFATDAESGVDFVDGLADDTPVEITGVTINGVAASFTVSGDGVIVSGVKTGDVVGFTTDGDHQRVLIENAQPTSGNGSNISFDLGGFTILQVSSDVVEVGSKADFEDDGVSITVDDTSDDSNGDPATYGSGAQGTWTDNPGEDGLGPLNVTFDQFQVDAHGFVDTTATNSTFEKGADDFHYTGSITADFNSDGKNDTVDFTLTLNDDGTYDVAVTTPPAQETTFDTSQGSLAAGGPDAVQTLLFGGSAADSDDIVFFGAVATAPKENGAVGSNPNDLEDLVVVGPTDLTESQLEGLNVPTLINTSTQMNVSTSGIGINNNNLDGNGTSGIQATDESFVVNPETVVDKVTVFIDNSVGGYNPASEQLYYTVYFTNGDVVADTLVTAGMLSPVTSGVAAGGKSFTIEDTTGDREIDAVQLTMGLGKVKIPVISFTVEETFNPESLDLKFTAEEFDGDGDSDADGFSVHFDPDPLT